MKQHPTMDTLLAYLEDAEHADFADVRLHLATCRDCRAEVQRLTNLHQCLQSTGPYQHRLAGVSPQLASALEQHTIERYVDGELDAHHSASVTQLLATDSGALKAALHYASHSAASSQLRGEHGAVQHRSHDAPVDNRNAFIHRLKQFFDFRPPLWISVPATAAVVLGITVALMPAWKAGSTQQGYTVASYQDKPLINYQGANQPPGIGFFNKAHRSTEPFGPMEIRFDNRRQISLHWPAVPKATTYHLAVYLISEGQKITVRETDVGANQASIPNFDAVAGKRYEWTLNGDTSDARSFYATGGFVINLVGKDANKKVIH